MNSQPFPTINSAQLFEQFSSKLARVAARHLDRRLVGRVDEEDIVQSAFRTFFRRSDRGDFQIDGSLEIWRLLVHITVLKARAKGRYHTNAIRDVRKEVSLDDVAQLLSQEPTPDEAVTLVDLVSELLKGRPSWYCDALQKRLEGCSTTEIAAELKLSQQSIQRGFRLLQKRLAIERETMNSQKIPNSA